MRERKVVPEGQKRQTVDKGPEASIGTVEAGVVV